MALSIVLAAVRTQSSLVESPLVDQKFAPSEQRAHAKANISAEPAKAFAPEFANDSLAQGENKTAMPAFHDKTPEESARAKKEGRQGAWAVQAIATTDKGIATAWLEKLRAKGYEPFVVETEVKGQIRYRVRAGHFSTRAEAESLREILKSRDGLSDAFVALTTKSETVVALSPP
jgi:cell division septation protein DedD